MSDPANDMRAAQFAYVAAYVRQLDPTATDAAISRYLAEIETMAAALQELEVPATTQVDPFTADWPDGADA
jgi:hypothetical protein